MHGTNVHSTIVPDALTIIAVCTGSRRLLELGIALKAVATGKVWLPPAAEDADSAMRIARNLLSPQWTSRARTALAAPQIEYLAGHFLRVCVTCVPTQASDPLNDRTWLAGVRALYGREHSLPMLANALLSQLHLPDEPDSAVPAPAPVPVVARSHEIQTKLIARLRLIARAKRFVEQFARNWEAQKARTASAMADVRDEVKQATTPAFEAPAEAVPAVTITTPATEPAYAETVHIDEPRAIAARKPMRSFFRRPISLSAFITAPSTVPPAIRSEMRGPIAMQPQGLSPPAAA